MRQPLIRIIWQPTYLVGDDGQARWWCTLCPLGDGHEHSIADAADAGRQHLRAVHLAPTPLTPVVQTIVSGTRCTCGDLPNASWPYFNPCPVHSCLINTTTNRPDTALAAGGSIYAATYCRACGVRRDQCGHGTTPVQPANDAEAHRDPRALNVALRRAAQARNGTYDPLDQAHNEGARR